MNMPFDELSLALNHTREMMRQYIDNRLRNFNFCIIINGVILAAISQIGGNFNIVSISIIGIIVNITFFIADKRGLQFILIANGHLSRMESQLGISTDVEDSNNNFRIFGVPIVSHTFAYRLIFVSSILSFIVVFIRSLI